jgi:hypothetical protein
MWQSIEVLIALIINIVNKDQLSHLIYITIQYSIQYKIQYTVKTRFYEVARDPPKKSLLYKNEFQKINFFLKHNIPTLLAATYQQATTLMICTYFNLYFNIFIFADIMKH